MFAGSAKTPEELAYKLRIHLTDLIRKEEFQKFLDKKFPNCSRHYNNWRSNNGTTWQLERPAQVMLFSAARDSPEILDYTLLQINPQPSQILGFEEVSQGLKAIEGKVVLEVLCYVSKGEGFAEKCRMYER